MAVILVTDDSSFQRTIITSILKTEGYDVIQAKNGREGLDLARSHKPDLMILDILMPDINGIEILQEIKASSPDLPVIMSTADIQNTTQEECMKKGATAFLTKPIKKAVLLEAVIKALSKD